MRDGPKTVFYLERNVDGTIGGSYRSLLYLVRLLAKDRWRPVVAFYRDHELVPEFRSAGCTVYLLRHPSPVKLVGGSSSVAQTPVIRSILLGLQKLINLRGASALCLRYLWLLRREGVALVHMNNGVATSSELLTASRLLGIPTIAHQRGIGPIPSQITRRIDSIAAVICVSDAARDNLVRQGVPPERCRTVHNGIDPEEFPASIARDAAAVRAELGVPGDALVVGNSGMIRGWKGQLTLVQAMARLRAVHPDVFCLLVGGVSDRYPEDVRYAEEIRALIDENGMANRILLTGYQSRVAEFVQTFDVMVHTAVDPEPFSRSVLEGMALGRPIVATRTGGTPEAIEHGVCGLLVPPRDAAAMADAIDSLLKSPALRQRLGAEAKRRVRERFSISANVDATERIYRELLERDEPSSAALPSVASGGKP